MGNPKNYDRDLTIAGLQSELAAVRDERDRLRAELEFLARRSEQNFQSWTAERNMLNLSELSLSRAKADLQEALKLLDYHHRLSCIDCMNPLRKCPTKEFLSRFPEKKEGE